LKKDLQCLPHVETLHLDHDVLEVEQDCDMGSQNWIMNHDRQYHDTSQCFAPLDVGLAPKPAASANLQSSSLIQKYKNNPKLGDKTKYLYKK
jgi:hypothetical protein